ncbi:MAG TPA: hypothetical protein VN669_13065 [Candidatus Acidoferrales bacterium]|nr:hypothetical protein [Candidatus Acidoferrales bacterium]
MPLGIGAVAHQCAAATIDIDTQLGRRNKRSGQSGLGPRSQSVQEVIQNLTREDALPGRGEKAVCVRGKCVNKGRETIAIIDRLVYHSFKLFPQGGRLLEELLLCIERLEARVCRVSIVRFGDGPQVVAQPLQYPNHF